MQAKPVHRRHPGRSVKAVAFLALTMAMALISALLIIYTLVKAAESEPLSDVGGRETDTAFVLAHEASLANLADAKDQAPRD